ncbi:MAG: DUF695 domain-containing protein [Prevotella sp.]|nr:DUF695 domain-containing protein [Prevotella sp.]MCM1074486.1 DUF695 domain-containing protein [Ruminococcus sp.]
MAESKEIWWTAPAESESGKTILVSGRDGLDAQMASAKYNDRVQITWQYNGDAAGLPDAETASLMEQADEALRVALKKEKGCLLTGIYTGDNQRDWVFYVKHTSIFQSMLNRAWCELPLLPVSISAEKDPEWAEYKEMKDSTYIPDAE